MAKCNICDKRPMFGNNRSHAMNATRRTFKPNLGKRRLIINGREQRLNVCRRCIRTLEKQGLLKIPTD